MTNSAPRDTNRRMAADGKTNPNGAGAKITLEQVRHVAKLSRLAIDEERTQRYAGQLESILEYVAQIDEVDVSGVEPMAHALPLKNVLRDDVVAGALPVEKVLQNAPETDGPLDRKSVV